MTILVSVPLIELAKREFPKLMRNRANAEDALQTLMLVQHATKGKGALDYARHALAWLEYELGVVPQPPVCPKPPFYPGGAETAPASERALENKYILGTLASGRARYEVRRTKTA